ncbi:MAG: GNAT family N-acetyltransferase [Gemmatimonas sp.]
MTPAAPIEICLLGPHNADALGRVAENVFDAVVDERWAAVFVNDPRHHMILAIESGVIVGMVSAVDYVHPDKAPQLWINEIGVALSHQRRGIGRTLLDAILAHGRTLGCTEAWLGTEEDNLPARGLYEHAGSTPEKFVLYSFPLDAVPCDTQPASA